MFDEPEVEVDPALGVLALEKILYDHTGKILNTELDSDFLFENYLESLYRCADNVWDDYRDEEETQVQYFIDRGITEYIALAHEYGKRHHKHRKENPWFMDARRMVDDTMNEIQSYSHDWQMIWKRSRKLPVCFVFYTYPEFYQPVQVLQAVASVIAFFRQGAEALKQELCATAAQGEPPANLLQPIPKRKAA